MMVFLIPRLLAALSLFSVANAAPFGTQDKSSPILPSSDPFYNVPDGISKLDPGTIIEYRTPPFPIAAFGLAPVNLQATHQILYRTTDSLGNATATVLTVLVPHNADYSKVLSYQVAEDAATTNCAPSYALQLNSATGPLHGTAVTQAELLLMVAALEQGWIVIAPDYEGPKSAFLSNKLAGHATLDGIRAAINSGSFTGISKKPRVTMWGYSGGSLATNWAAELHPTYAPELEIAGAAVGGTVPNLTSVVTAVNGGAFAGLVPIGVLGLAAQYPEFAEAVKKHLKSESAEKFQMPLKQCLVANAATFLFEDVLSMFDDPNIIYTDPIARILEENALGKATPKIPFYWYHSVLDQVSPVKDTDALVGKYCDAGVSIKYERDIASEHGSHGVTGAPKALSWLKEVMDGKTPQKECTKNTVLASLLDPASVEILPKFILDALLDLLGKPVGPMMIG